MSIPTDSPPVSPFGDYREWSREFVYVGGPQCEVQVKDHNIKKGSQLSHRLVRWSFRHGSERTLSGQPQTLAPSTCSLYDFTLRQNAGLQVDCQAVDLNAVLRELVSSILQRRREDCNPTHKN
mmetsp:Transcript_34817/g.68744  ORF Transcript_34817/g.68744 Transcript_34817/m.68744 type:complete len:123 (-) Transcript_34817:125-493(-)